MTTIADDLEMLAAQLDAPAADQLAAAEEANAAAEAAEAKKRGPGRPSKTPQAPPTRHYGIVDTPKFPNSILELGYQDPSAFKHLFSFLEKLKCSEVVMHGTPSQLTINSSDSTEKINVMAVVDGNTMNHYYCGREFWLSITLSDIDKIFRCIDKTFNIIKFHYSATDTILLEIQLCNSAIAKTNQFTAVVTELTQPPATWDNVADLYNARGTSSISMRLPSKSFKKTHEIAINTAKVVNVQYTGGQPQVTLEWNGTGFAPCKEVYTNLGAISFQSRMRPGDIMSLKYSALCGKNLSAAVINEHVELHMWDRKPVLALFEGPGITVAAEMRLVDE